MSKTLFIDLDGTLVYHNYRPLEEADRILPGVLDFLTEARAKGYFVVLTTNRSQEKAQGALDLLKNSIQFNFDRALYDLPVGIRVLINDNKDQEVRALAMPLERNKGLVGISP